MNRGAVTRRGRSLCWVITLVAHVCGICAAVGRTPLQMRLQRLRHVEVVEEEVAQMEGRSYNGHIGDDDSYNATRSRRLIARVRPGHVKLWDAAVLGGSTGGDDGGGRWMERESGVLPMKGDDLIIDKGQWIDLDGNISAVGEYYLPLNVGLEGVPISAQVDTGSVVTALPAVNCKVISSTSPSSTPTSCRKPNESTYDESSASTLSCSSGGAVIGLRGRLEHCPSEACSAANGCGFEVTYGDGSMIRGRLVEDTVTVGGLTTAGVVVGAIDTETTATGRNFQLGVVEGIVGLAYNSYHRDQGPSIFDRIAEVHGLPNVFAMGIDGETGSRQVTEGADGGSLVLGGWDEEAFVGDIAWVKITRISLYHIDLRGMLIGDSAVTGVDFSKLSCIVDSGTTKIVLPSTLRDPLISLFRDAMQAAGISSPDATELVSGQRCFSDRELPDESLDALPTMTFHVNGWQAYDSVSLSLTPRNYLPLLGSDPGRQCRAFYAAFQDLPDGMVILGNAFMTGFYTIYDRRMKRLGFGAATEGNRISKQRPSYAIFKSFTPMQNILLISLASFICVRLVWALACGLYRLARRGGRRDGGSQSGPGALLSVRGGPESQLLQRSSDDGRGPRARYGAIESVTPQRVVAVE